MSSVPHVDRPLCSHALDSGPLSSFPCRVTPTSRSCCSACLPVACSWFRVPQSLPYHFLNRPASSLSCPANSSCRFGPHRATPGSVSSRSPRSQVSSVHPSTCPGVIRSPCRHLSDSRESTLWNRRNPSSSDSARPQFSASDPCIPRHCCSCRRFSAADRRNRPWACRTLTSSSLSSREGAVPQLWPLLAPWSSSACFLPLSGGGCCALGAAQVRDWPRSPSRESSHFPP